MTRLKAKNAQPANRTVDPTRIILGGEVRPIDNVLPGSMELEAWREVAQTLLVGYDFVPKIGENGKPMKDPETGVTIGMFHVRCATLHYELALAKYQEIMGVNPTQIAA